MNETQAYIGAIVKTRFAYHDLETDKIAFKSRPFLIVGAFCWFTVALHRRR